MSKRSFAFECAGAVFELEGPESEGFALFRKRLARFESEKRPDWIVAVPELEAPSALNLGEGTQPQRPLPRVEMRSGGYGLRDVDALAELHGRRLDVGKDADFWWVDFCLRWICGLAFEARGGVLFHGVGLSQQGSAALFIGPSGAGKSTLGRVAPDGGVELLSDELLGATREGELFATPWNVGFPRTGKLKILGTLGWSAEPRMGPLSPSEWLRMAADNILLPTPASRPVALSVLTQLAQNVRTAKLFFSPDARVGVLLQHELRATS